MEKELLKQMWPYTEWKDVGHGTHIVLYNKNGEFEIDAYVPKKAYDKYFGIGQYRIDKAIDKLFKRGGFKLTLEL